MQWCCRLLPAAVAAAAVRIANDEKKKENVKREMPWAWGAELTRLNRAGKLRAQKSRFFFSSLCASFVIRLVSFRVQFLTNIMLMCAGTMYVVRGTWCTRTGEFVASEE